MKTLTIALTVLSLSLLSIPASARTVFVENGGNCCQRVVKVKVIKYVRTVPCCAPVVRSSCCW